MSPCDPKEDCVRDHRHLFDNEQTACMEASKNASAKCQPRVAKEWVMQKTASIAVTFAGLERQP
jgi:hypothetical protein